MSDEPGGELTRILRRLSVGMIEREWRFLKTWLQVELAERTEARGR